MRSLRLKFLITTLLRLEFLITTLQHVEATPSWLLNHDPPRHPHAHRHQAKRQSDRGRQHLVQQS
jgi:hypothetical protein